MAPFGKRLRRYHHSRGHGPLRLHPAAVVGICLGAAVLITLIVGNLLNMFLDDDTYWKLTAGEETETADLPTQQSAVRDVNAYPYLLGSSLDGIIGQSSASVRLNRTDGSLLYTSDVASYYGIAGNGEVALSESVADLGAFVPYVSGVFYSHAFDAATSDLRYAETAKESAILREFLNAGGSEVLILGLPLEAERTDEVISYLKTVRLAAGRSPIGVAIPREVAAREENWELLARLWETCDFLALDLSAETVDGSDLDDAGISENAAALLEDCRYLLSAYDMRLLFSEMQTALISTAVTQMRRDFQILGNEP